MELFFEIVVYMILIMIIKDVLIWFLVQRYRDRIENDLIKVLQQTQENLVEVKVEKYEECFYFFRADNNGFVVQGNSKQEVLDKIKCKPIKLVIVDGDQEVLSQLSDWAK